MANRLTGRSGAAKPLVRKLSVLVVTLAVLGFAASSSGSDSAEPGSKERYAKISRDVTHLFP